MLKKAKERGFEPDYVMMDSWYASPKNLKFVARQGWLFLIRLKSNRLVNPDDGECAHQFREYSPEGRVVHLRGFGWVKVLKKV